MSNRSAGRRAAWPASPVDPFRERLPAAGQVLSLADAVAVALEEV